MNFDPEKLRKFLNCASNPSNPMETKVKNYYVNQEIQEFASFDIDFENVDIALRIAGMLGKSATKFTINHFLFPDTNKIDYIQFIIFEINDSELLAFLEQL
ncbi:MULTISPECIES: hypothetical protein [Bacillus]|uniref:hypothetical protein n=1 Tax=Bacillus TaxID=1386 RepID=UPI00057C1D46|nr:MULTISPECIES: hypothetical protein [Bacillus]POO77135.1 hypothetical protein C1T30_38760 [Bacillus sp. MBGLi97]MBZ5213857.1 hypothetical protein [Bacillus paralicheniformis]MCB6217129.1 hypothetical protein [Bacillus paralicheniformis]MCJ8224297.1 hypothetical protein [Bacillus paralicheniformis]MCU4668147.1 hypothetical protein [Bacillus paralicheniformis]